MGRPIGSSDGVMEKAQIVQQNMFFPIVSYYCIIVLYISLSCMLASLGKADAGCDDPRPCEPDKAIDGETFTALLSSRRHVCSQDSSPGGSATAREQERHVVGVESSRVMSCHVMSCRGEGRDLSVEDRRLLQGRRQCNVRAPYMWVERQLGG
jgi:hypothetical protein